MTILVLFVKYNENNPNWGNDSFLLRLNNKFDIIRTIAVRSNRFRAIKALEPNIFKKYVNASVTLMI